MKTKKIKKVTIKVNFIEYTNKKITNPMIIISSDDNNKNGSRNPPVKI
jgi:hypothetical protein